MAIPLTPEIMATAYEYLRSVPPMRGWKLPPSGDVVFQVTRLHTPMGTYQWTGTGHKIAVSSRKVGHTHTFLSLLAHEMIHLYLEMTGKESNDDTHNAAFKRLAVRVCNVHGFDPKEFY